MVRCGVVRCALGGSFFLGDESSTCQRYPTVWIGVASGYGCSYWWWRGEFVVLFAFFFVLTVSNLAAVAVVRGFWCARLG